MDWFRLTIQTTPMGIEILTGALDAQGIVQVEVVQDSHAIEAFLEDTEKFWDYVEPSVAEGAGEGSALRVVLPDNDVGRAQRKAVEEAVGMLPEWAPGLDLGSLEITADILHDEDWAEGWKKYYTPLEIGKRLLIRPEWTEAEAKGRVTVTLDPGMVFGTGQHESTALCLELLEDAVMPGDKVLDIGCGSGILAIAALQLGAAFAAGVDVDQNAPSIAMKNAAYNGLDEARCSFIAADVIEDDAARESLGGGYDVALANIVAGVLLPLTPHVPGFLKPGGRYVVSGIINTREDEVKAAMAKAGFVIERRLSKNDWVALAARREG